MSIVPMGGLCAFLVKEAVANPSRQKVMCRLYSYQKMRIGKVWVLEQNGFNID